MADSAAYQVVARRYRPQRFADLVGQEHVARGLSGAIESGRIGHAYLFTGARGVGKTSAARIYAKALECERGPAAEPCNECDSCRAISAGQDVDVVEIDAASNRGVDEIRQLRQNVAVRPARGRFKVYIIDEVHMLTREAFNALLKTLEEPPSHVKFVLCTTEPEKLPITILSRCQRFDFTTVDVAAIAGRLAQIVDAEGANVSAEALTLIARRAAGSMRDSQSLLEQLLGSAGDAVGVDDVHALIGTGREERVGELVAAIAARDPARGLAALDEALQGGADPGGVLDQVIAALRDCLLASVGCDPSRLTLSQGLGVDLAAVGTQLGTANLLAMLQIIDQTLSRMRTSGHPAILAEMAVIRLAGLDDLQSLATAIDRVAAATPPAAAAPSTRLGAAAAPPAPQKKTTELTADHEPPRPPPASAPATAPPSMQPPASAPLPADAHAAWLSAAATLDGLLADFAAEAVAATWRAECLEVSLPAAATTAVAFLRRPESTAAITTALAAVVGRRVRHAVALAEADIGAPTPVPSQPPRPVISQAALLREVSEHPLVAHALTVFDAAIRKVEPRQPRSLAAAPAGAAAPDQHGGDGVVEEEPTTFGEVTNG